MRIKFLTTGGFPGDGRPKPVAFPDPADSAVDAEGLKVVDLPMLSNLKLAFGMTNPGRLRDLADVQDLIRARRLPRELADQLNPFVRDRYLELRAAVRPDVPRE